MSRYIDADELITDLKIDIDESDMPEMWFVGARSMLRRVERFPTADVKPVVRGEWVEDGAVMKCSVCGNSSDYCGTENFCSYCGADMRGAR